MKVLLQKLIIGGDYKNQREKNSVFDFFPSHVCHWLRMTNVCMWLHKNRHWVRGDLYFNYFILDVSSTQLRWSARVCRISICLISIWRIHIWTLPDLGSTSICRNVLRRRLGWWPVIICICRVKNPHLGSSERIAWSGKPMVTPPPSICVKHRHRQNVTSHS